MQYILLIYGDQSSWDDRTEEERSQIFQAYGAFTQELRDSGAMLAGDALEPTETATTVRVQNDEVLTTDGPFAETKELVAGFWIWQVKSLDEAVEWIRRSPFQEGEIEIRPIMGAEDFGDALPQDVKDQENRLRAQIRS